MNDVQQKILYESLKLRGRFMNIASEHFKMSRTTLMLELEKLERQGLVELSPPGLKFKKFRITEKGKEALETSIVNDKDVSVQDQVKELREIVEALQLAIDGVSANKPKDKDLVDKLNKYLSLANGIPNLIKTVVELYGHP